MGILLPILYTVTSLGITFDLPSYNQGFNSLVYGDLHDKAVMEDKEELFARYKIINSPKDIRDFLRVDPRLAIRTKLNRFDTMISSVIRESVRSRETKVEIFISSRYIRAIEKIPPSQQVSKEWKSQKPREPRTHYVKSFLTGGHLLTSIVFPCRTAENKEKVMKAVVNNLNDSGTIDESFVGKMQKIKEELGDDYVDYRLETVHCSGCNAFPPRGLEQFVNFAIGLPKTVKSWGNGYGARLTMELEDLSTISDFPPYQENSKVIAKLDELDQMFDDVVIARDEFTETDFTYLHNEDEKEVDKFYGKVQKIRKAIVQAISHLDISPSASLHQFDDAYNAYGSTEDYQKYQKEFRALRDKMKKKI